MFGARIAMVVVGGRAWRQEHFGNYIGKLKTRVAQEREIKRRNGCLHLQESEAFVRGTQGLDWKGNAGESKAGPSDGILEGEAITKVNWPGKRRKRLIPSKWNKRVLECSRGVGK